MTDGGDLDHASRADLLALLSAQQATIATLQQRVADLERRLGSSGGQGVPGTKPAGSTRSRATGQPRKRRAHGFARPRSTAPTSRVEHAAAQCPHCATPLAGGWVQRRREVLEAPAVPLRVVEHVYLARQCPQCRRRIVPPAELDGVVAGRQRLGVGLVSLIATLREEGRLPVRTIQWYLRTLHGLSLSVGAIVAASARVAAQGTAAVAALRAELAASPAVHADETGWREQGRNGYAWTFGTPTIRYFAHGSRHKEMVETVLGDGFSGVLSCDFYAGYHHYRGRKQRCWAHLLRDIHDLRTLYPADTGLAAWATAVQAVFADARAAPTGSVAAQQGYEQRLWALCEPHARDPVVVQGRLCRRIERHLPELFVFVAEPTVPADNNAAERSLRHLVTARKISGGTRSRAGTATKMTLASLFGTWRARGRDPLRACHALLVAPQP